MLAHDDGGIPILLSTKGVHIFLIHKILDVLPCYKIKKNQALFLKVFIPLIINGL